MGEHITFMPKHYEMDPELEDIVLGCDLRDGMEVLIEDPRKRLDIVDGKVRVAVVRDGDDVLVEMIDEDRAYALRWNRWMLVSNIRFNVNGEMAFIATYEDGTKKSFKAKTLDGWIVKLHSIPASNVAEKTLPPYAERDIAFVTNFYNHYRPEDIDTHTRRFNVTDPRLPALPKRDKGTTWVDPMPTTKIDITPDVLLGIDYSGPAPEATIRGGASEDEHLKGLREKLEIPEPPIYRGPEMFKKND